VVEKEVNAPWAINMITMINQNTTPTQFEAACKNNPNYELKMRGPCGPCRGGTALHMAVKLDNLKMTKFFIKNLGTKNIDLINANNNTPLMCAVEDRGMFPLRKNETNMEIIHQLLMAGADANLAWDDLRFDGFHYSLLSRALADSDLALTKLLLLYGAKKLVAFAPNKNALIKQELTDKEDKIYKLAKKEIRDMQNLFILGGIDPNSPLNGMPKEIILHILISGKVESSNQQKINEAKKMIEENEKQTHLIENGNSGNNLLIADF
jgi:ankyrin repeat protein